MLFPAVLYECESQTIKKLSTEELMLWNCGAREDSWEFLDSKEIKSVNPKGNQLWIFIGRADAKAEDPVIWPRIVKSRLIGKDWRQEKGMTRGWDGWMASLTQWTWVWESSGRWWRIRKPDKLQSIGLQRIRHDWAMTMY